MAKVLKVVFCALGSLFVGFGLGLVISNFLIMTIGGLKYWLTVSGIFVFGGFLLGIGFAKKISKAEDFSRIKTMADDQRKEEAKKILQTPK